MSIGDNVRTLRLARGWSQEDLAVKAGLSRAYGYLQVSAWEIGRQKPSAKNIGRLCDALAVSSDELLGVEIRAAQPFAVLPPSVDGESWADVAGFEGLYKISSHGRLFSLSREEAGDPAGKRAYTRLHKSAMKRPEEAGRLRHTLFRNGVPVRIMVAHMVLEAFHGPPPGRVGLHDDEYSSNHKNGNWRDNRIENLEWLRNQDHRKHTVASRLNARRESHPKAKLTWAQVREIRRRAGKQSHPSLGREFGVSPSAIFSIIHNITWREDG